ncbi:hypothetical protein HFN86_35735 [Rhizobium laguerreae]|nr:hypothetical protein [Rhizobium laguerreae]
MDLDRSTLAVWVGRATCHLRPVHQQLLDVRKTSSKLFADKTPSPPNPGHGKTKTGSYRSMRVMIDHGREPIHRWFPYVGQSYMLAQNVGLILPLKLLSPADWQTCTAADLPSQSRYD